MITEEQLQKVREPIPFTPTKRLERDDVLYVTEDDIPHPTYGYAKAHKEYSVIDLRGYRKGYEPRLEISGIYTPNPEDIFRLQTGKLPPYQPTATGDKLLAEMRRLEVHKAFRIGEPEEVPAVPEVKLPEGIKRDGLNYVAKNKESLKQLTEIEDGATVKIGNYWIKVKFSEGTKHYENASLLSTVEDFTTGKVQDVYVRPVFIDKFLSQLKEITVKPPGPEVKGDLECMICHKKFDHLIHGTCESCYKKWTKGRG